MVENLKPLLPTISQDELYWSVFVRTYQQLEEDWNQDFVPQQGTAPYIKLQTYILQLETILNTLENTGLGTRQITMNYAFTLLHILLYSLLCDITRITK